MRRIYVEFPSSKASRLKSQDNLYLPCDLVLTGEPLSAKHTPNELGDGLSGKNPWDSSLCEALSLVSGTQVKENNTKW